MSDKLIYDFGRENITNNPRIISPETQIEKTIPVPIVAPIAAPACSASLLAPSTMLPTSPQYENNHINIKILNRINPHLNKFPKKPLLSSRSCTPHFGHLSAESLTSF